MGGNRSIHRSIRHEIEWLAVTGDVVHGRICGMPLREAQHAAQRLFPEVERDVQIVGRAAATAAQLRGSAAAPVINPRTLAQAGIEPLWRIARMAGHRADRAGGHAGGGR